MPVLSIQSWVSVGHVGNAAAVFALQTLGVDTWPVLTTRFSNHPGRGGVAGAVTAADEIAAMVAGIAALGVLPACEAVLSGYVGEADTVRAVADAAARARAANPAAIWCCDPVIGDDGRVYVRPGVEAALRDMAIPEADVTTPNQFELARLTGMTCGTTADLLAAADALRARMRGRRVLVTGARTADTPADAIDVLAIDDGCWRVRTPMLDRKFNGAGDLMAAVFLAHLLGGATMARAASMAASAVHSVLRRTASLGTPELALVAARGELVHPSSIFHAERLASP